MEQNLATAQTDTENTSENSLQPIPQPIPMKRIGTTLVDAGHITNDQLRIALLEQKGTDKEMLGATLLRLGFIGPNNLAQALAERAGTEAIDLKSLAIDPALLIKVPANIASKHLVLPIRMTARQVDLAMADPFDIVAIDAVRPFFSRHIEIVPHVAPKAELEDIISTLKDPFDTIDQILKDLDEYEEPKEFDENTPYEHPIIRLVNHVMIDAVGRGASDIHFEPEETHVRIRYRLDGVLRQMHALHLSHWPALSHRIKIMANMNIADTRSIQDGRFSQTICDGLIDFRVAIMPSVWGETVSVRLLDHRRSLIPLEKLGYSPKAVAKLAQITQKPQGITLVTGPTGSGKTTTLYSLLQKMSTEDVHIATLEDPVEFQLDMIRQTSIQEDQGLTFATGVRGLLRMDPDIILIGEIRDPETAKMALRAAMTGHQVYTTLHCNDALGALPRLIDLGLNPRVLAGNLSGIIAQRLVRKLCTHCSYTYDATEQERALLGKDHISTFKLAGANGCTHCDGTGRQGRTVIAEVITPDAKMNELMAMDAMPSALHESANKTGLITMQDDGIARVMNHEVAINDLKRAVDMTGMV